MLPRIHSVWLIFGLAGCGDPIKHVELIEEPRVLAARAEVVGDEMRATPNPGETVQVRWLVAAPDGDPPSGFALSACSAPKQTRGVLHCESTPFASDVGDAASPNPRFEFTVPAELNALTHPRLGILGSLCAHGNGTITSNLPSCEAGSELPVSFDFFLAGDESTNLNPNFAADAITLDDAVWDMRELADGACLGLGLPEVSRSAGHHPITIAIPDSAREPLVQHNAADAPRESLRISHFASAGELERPFSEVLPDDSASPLTLTWNPPKQAPADGELVRFWFVVRDLRGGSDFTERALCLTP
jgi:hypothetical protein